MPDENPAAITHHDIFLLAKWLEDDGATAHEIVGAIECPWKWREEIEAARLLFGAHIDAGWIE